MTADHTEQGDVCERCNHPFGPHVMIVTTQGSHPEIDHPIPGGGIMLCDVKGCQCFGTWSAPQLGSERADVYVPPMSEIEALREQVQVTDPRS